jgi:hypothetical protein
MNDLTAVQEALDAGRLEDARELLRELLKTPDAETYYIAAQAAVTEQQKRDFLLKAIEIDPFHTKAHKALESAKAPPAPSVKSDAVASRSPKPHRGIPRAGLLVLAAAIIAIIVVGGLLVTSNNSSYNATQSAIARSNLSSNQTRAASNARSTTIAGNATTAARNGPALTVTASAQVKVGQDFLRYYFTRNYNSAGNLACRSIANSVNSGKYSNMARAIDKMFGADPKVTNSTCKLVNGILQCNVRGTFNYNNFEYELDLRTTVENGKTCVSNISAPK